MLFGVKVVFSTLRHYDKIIGLQGNIMLVNTKAFKRFFYQAVFVALLVIFFLSLASQVHTNLEKIGVASGFDFLTAPAGFDIIQHLVDYNETSTYGRVYVVGILNTILVSVIGIACATIIGLFIGLGQLSSNWLVSRLCMGYVGSMRNIPLLLHIFFWYFAALRMLPSPRQSLEFFNVVVNIRGIYFPELVCTLPTLIIVGLIFLCIGSLILCYKQFGSLKYVIGSLAAFIISFLILTHFTTAIPAKLEGFNFSGGHRVIPELLSMIFALSIYTAAYIAEIIRGSIIAVPKGQWEAARSLGMSIPATIKEIILPQALRIIIPPLTNQYLNLTKNSSLSTAIAYPDLVSIFTGTSLNQTGQAVEIIAMSMAVYLTLSLTISLCMNLYERSCRWSSSS